MKLTHAVTFTFELDLPQASATSFVRDASLSLSKANFIEGLEVSETEPPVVSASLPVNAALFGQQLLKFESRIVETPKGAKLEPLPLDTDQLGWAEVAGEATVSPTPQGSEVFYQFDITIHLKLPNAEKWGGQALTRMIEFTAQHVLENVTANFPLAVQEAAKEAEARYAA